MMGEIEMVAIGLLLGLLALALGGVVAHLLDGHQEQRRQNMRKNRLHDYNSYGRLSSAYAASDLVPWILEMGDLQGCRIQVLGGDGTYINQKSGSVWSKGLKDWIEKGLYVDYILLGIDQSTRKRYLDLMTELNRNNQTRLRVKVARKPNGGYPDDVNKIREDLRTCHPTLLYGSDRSKRAMWIEGDHQPNSEFAYDVWYVPPNAMDEECKDEFEHYEHQVETIKPYCVDLIEATV